MTKDEFYNDNGIKRRIDYEPKIRLHCKFKTSLDFCATPRKFSFTEYDPVTDRFYEPVKVGFSPSQFLK